MAYLLLFIFLWEIEDLYQQQENVIISHYEMQMAVKK